MAAGVKRGRRIVILCEGKTEDLAIRFFILKQWAKDGLSSVGLDRVNLRGHLDKVAPYARNYLDDPEVLAVFTLVDLYGMTYVNHPQNDNLDAKVRRVQEWLRDPLQMHDRSQYFVPHVSVHEVEAWILAEGAALARKLADRSIKPVPQAEIMNFQNPPSKQMNELFLRSKGRHYQKIEDGEPLFSQMEFPPVYDSCPYFRKFYDDLSKTARRP